MGKLIMSDKEREQAKVFEQVKIGSITQVEAAAKLRITDRWVRKKIKRYYENGDDGIVHGSRGKPSTRRWDEQEKKLLIELLQGQWRFWADLCTGKA